MGSSVTERVRHAPRVCARCGESFTPKRADALFCGGGCRVAAHRERRRVTGSGNGANGASCNGSRVRLTAELREFLRREVDRRRREVLRGPSPDELAALRALFDDEREAV
jgi:hypothetical protein